MSKAKSTRQNQQTEQQPTSTPSAFEQALAFVLEHEGGYVDDPRDPGRETNYGISKRAYPNEDIENLTIERASEIYQADYWHKSHCDELPEPLALAVFDTAVNMGVGVAAQLMQRALRVSVDGIVGPKTLAAAKEADPAQVVQEFLSWRLRRYSGLYGSPTYMCGWSRRVLALQACIAVMVQPEQEAA